MSDAAEASEKADFEARVQRYLALGFTNERTVHQLIRTGYALAQIKARFPELPAHVFEQLPVPQRRIAKTLEAARSGASERVKVNQLSAASVPQPPPIIQVLEKLKAQAQTSTEIVPGDGISFHYVPLNTSPMGIHFGGSSGQCPVTESVSDRLVRLPLFHDLREDEVSRVNQAVAEYFQRK